MRLIDSPPIRSVVFYLAKLSYKYGVGTGDFFKIYLIVPSFVFLVRFHIRWALLLQL